MKLMYCAVTMHMYGLLGRHTLRVNMHDLAELMNVLTWDEYMRRRLFWVRAIHYNSPKLSCECLLLYLGHAGIRNTFPD